MAHTRRVLALAVAGTIALGACSANSDERPTLSSKTERPAPSTTTTLAPYISLVATATVPEVQIFDAPGGPAPVRSFPNPWLLNDDPGLAVPLVFLVAERDGAWLKVHLPERPNGSTGWVRASDVSVTQNRFRVVVELAAHQITVYDGESVLLQEPVAIGKDATPTPPGTYYLRVLLKAPDPDTVYGPYAYGLSGHSDVLTSFNGGDGELGIHGNNDASVLGTSVSNGCVRMSNDGITRLTGILPLGTPVSIA